MRNPWLKSALAALIGISALLPADSAFGLIGSQRFTVSPALQIATGTPPGTLASTTVSNTTPYRYKVRVVPVRLRQELTGLYSYGDSPADRQWAARVLKVDHNTFTLNPNTKQQIGARWLGLPVGDRAVAVGIAVIGAPVSVTKSSLGS